MRSFRKMPVECNFAPPYAVPVENICFLINKGKDLRDVDEITIISVLKEQTYYFELAKTVFNNLGCSLNEPFERAYTKYLQNASILKKDGTTEIIPAIRKWVKNKDETIWREAGFSHWHRGFRCAGPTDPLTGLTCESRVEFGTEHKEKGKWSTGLWMDPLKDIQMEIEQNYYDKKSRISITGYNNPSRGVPTGNINTSLLKNNQLSEPRHQYDSNPNSKKFEEAGLFLSRIELRTDPDALKGMNDMGGIPALLNFTPTYPRWRKTEPTLP